MNRQTNAALSLLPLGTAIPATVLDAPTWQVIAILSVTALLAIPPMIVTQVIRLRASNRDPLKVHYIENQPLRRRR